MADQQQVQTDLAACEKALHELVSAVVEHDERRRAATASQPIKAVTWSDMASIDLDRAEFEELTEDPVRFALRSGIKKIGKAIFRLGGSTDAMSAILDRVADLDPNWASRRISIVDHTWNGIGEGEDRWWA